MTLSPVDDDNVRRGQHACCVTVITHLFQCYHQAALLSLVRIIFNEFFGETRSLTGITPSHIVVPFYFLCLFFGTLVLLLLVYIVHLADLNVGFDSHHKHHALRLRSYEADLFFRLIP